jgi:CHAD domain-containing protein
MACELRENESPGENFLRVATDQLRKAVAEIDDPALGAEKAVHQVRKRCKKLRALARLFRKPLGRHYKGLDLRYRALAQGLSQGRDLKALADAWNDIAVHGPVAMDGADLDLVKEHAEKGSNEAGELPLARARDALILELEVLSGLYLTGKREKALPAALRGARATYRRARRAMAAAYASGRDEDFHRWRKAAKYHGYQCRMMKGLRPHALRSRVAVADRLGKSLGRHHDLAVLRLALSGTPDFAAGAKEAYAGLIARRQEELRREAAPDGIMLFLDRPSIAFRRIRADKPFRPATATGGA